MKKLTDGAIRQYHYAFRGGPCFWTSDDACKAGDPAYAIAYADILKKPAPVVAIKQGKSTESVVKKYLESAHFEQLAPRTKADYSKYLTGFVKEFGEDPIAMFEETESVAEIRKWKNTWAHSPKQYDYATVVVTLLLNWAVVEERALSIHHHKDIKRLYKACPSSNDLEQAA